MERRNARSSREAKLWLRLLLVAVTGAVPLFVVSLLLTRATYRAAIDFGTQEQHGLAFQRRLEAVLETLPRYVLAIESPSGSAAHAAAGAAEQELDRTIQALARDYRGELGRELRFSASSLHAHGRDEASLGPLEQRWEALKHPPPSRQAIAAAARQLAASVCSMTEQTADSSNLVLDQDLDSYYLMDIGLVALPRAQLHVFEIQEAVADWLRGDRSASSARQIAALAALLREADLARIARDAQSAIVEDAQFNGVSASLQAGLPPAISGFAEATNRLLSMLDRLAAGETVPGTEVEAATMRAEAASFDLFRTSAGELDALLATRLRATEKKRLGAYSVIVATLLGAAFVMGLLIRGSLAARYAEILESQAELQAKEEQLRSLGDNLPGGMVYQLLREPDGSMRFLYVSRGIEQLHGVTAEAVLKDATVLYDLLVEEDRPALQAAELESRSRKVPFRHIARSRRKSDGEIRWFEFTSAPRELPDGGVMWDGVQMDITERRLAEAAVEQTQQRFSHIFDDSPIPMTLTTVGEGKYVAVNDAFLKATGYARDEVLGRTSREIGIYDNLEQRARVLHQLETSGSVHGIDVVFRTKNGQPRDNLLWVELLTIGAEKFTLAMSLDVSEQKEATRQQRELEEQLRQTQKLEALGTLAGGIAHDFNNMLGAMISFTELSKLENPDNELLQENLDQILAASKRATVLVRQILSFSRHQKEERKTLQLAPIVKEALSLLRATLPSTIALEQAIDADVSDVLANATQVHQIVMNLCTNAAHAIRGKHGKITVSLAELSIGEGAHKPHVELEPGKYVRLTITDTGHGMDATTLQRIFEPFFTTKPAGEGTGLGLSVVHGIVKEYGGVVLAESEPGRGTSFVIYLPAVSGAAAEIASDSAEVPRGKGERVLFVDDEVALGNAGRKMLERLGYQATVFGSSVTALLAFRQAPRSFSIVVTDYTMPDLTGLDLIREIHAIRPDIPAIMVSGSSGPIVPEELREAGVLQVLSKPLGYTALAHALCRALYQGALTSTG
jgi:PAS domain S-box-containing protein